MNILGMGPMELVLIMVLALIVFGPGKLPEIAGQVGRMVRDFRHATSEMSSEFNKAFTLEGEHAAQSSSASPSSAPHLPSLSSGTSEASADSAPGGESIAPPTITRKNDLQPPY